MILGENIYNAFSVVEKTYENVQKLLEYCKSASEEKGEYELVTPRFLRYKSDNYCSGWGIKSFVIAFQSTEIEPMKQNEWRNAPLYVMEINLCHEAYDQPMLTLAKYTYKDMKDWTRNCSPSSHYVFFEPLYDFDYVENSQNDKVLYSLDVPSESSDRYWGLKKVECVVYPLVDVTRENAGEIIFGSFNYLRGLKSE